MNLPFLLTVTLIQRLLSAVKMEQLMYLTCIVGDAPELSGKLGEIYMIWHLAKAIKRLSLGNDWTDEEQPLEVELVKIPSRGFDIHNFFFAMHTNADADIFTLE